MTPDEKNKIEKMLRRIIGLVQSIGRGRFEGEALAEIRKEIEKNGFDINDDLRKAWSGLTPEQQRSIRNRAAQAPSPGPITEKE